MVRLSLLALTSLLSILATLTTATPVKQHASSSKLQPAVGDIDTTLDSHICGQDDTWYTLTPDQRQVCLLSAPAFNSALAIDTDHEGDDRTAVCDLPIDAEAVNDLKSGDMMKGPNPEKSKKYIEKLGRKMADEKLYAKIMSVDKKKLSKHKKLKRSIISKLIRLVKTKKEEVRLGKRSPDVQAYIQLQKNLTPLQSYGQKLVGKMVANKNIREHIITEATDASSLLRKLINAEQADKIVTALKSLDEPSGNSAASTQDGSDSVDVAKRDFGLFFVTGVVFGILFDALGIFGVFLFIFIILPFVVIFDLLQLIVGGIIYIGIIIPFNIICWIFAPCFFY